MTRLMLFLIPVVGVGMIWLALVTGLLLPDLEAAWWQLITPLPIYIAILFGFYGLANVGYNVYKVNSDDNALVQLLKDIDDAKAGLRRKGFIFN